MDFQLKVFDKIMSCEDESILPSKTEKILDKLININRVAQFEQLNLSDDECDEIINDLNNIESRLRINNTYVDQVKRAKAEYIPIILPEEDFI